MSLDFAVEGKPELARDARFDMDGFKNALKLRAELVDGDERCTADQGSTQEGRAGSGPTHRPLDH